MYIVSGEQIALALLKVCHQHAHYNTTTRSTSFFGGKGLILDGMYAFEEKRIESQKLLRIGTQVKEFIDCLILND
jgi:hypothetical protein